MGKKMWEKDKLLETSNFSFYHSVFYPFLELPSIFIKKKKKCRLQTLSFWNWVKFAVWEEVKIIFIYTERKKFFTSLDSVYKSMSPKRFRIEQLCPSTGSKISLVFVRYAIM